MQPEDLAPAILDGQFDDVLTDVIEALRMRQAEGSVELCWRIKYDDLDISEDNLTVAEAKLIEAATGESIRRLPVQGSAKNIAAVVAAALMERRKMKSSDAFDEVGAYGIKQLFNAVSEYARTSPPFDGGTPPTADTSPQPG